MVGASELRIGNWVKIGAHPVKVNAFGEKGISHDEGFERYKYVDPIPLTEEILLKSGFIKVYDTNWGLPFLFLPTSDIDFIGVNKDLKIFIKGIYPPCDYLHQLQNLFYSLCGKELEVKL